VGPPVPSGVALLLDILWGAGRTRPAQAFSLFLAIWMLGWAFGELLAVYTILYVLGGSRSCGVDRLDPAAVQYSADVGASGIQDQILATAMTEIPAFRVLNY